MVHLKLPSDLHSNQWFNEGKCDSFHKDLHDNWLSWKELPCACDIAGFKEILIKVSSASSYIFWELHILHTQKLHPLKSNVWLFATYYRQSIHSKSQISFCNFVAQHCSMAPPCLRDNMEAQALLDVDSYLPAISSPLISPPPGSKHIKLHVIPTHLFYYLWFCDYGGRMVKCLDQSFWAPFSLFKSWLQWLLATWPRQS